MKFPKCIYVVWHNTVTQPHGGWYELSPTLDEAIEEANEQGGKVATYMLARQGKPKIARHVEWESHRKL